MNEYNLFLRGSTAQLLHPTILCTPFFMNTQLDVPLQKHWDYCHMHVPHPADTHLLLCVLAGSKGLVLPWLPRGGP